MNLLKEEGEGWILHCTGEPVQSDKTPATPMELGEVLPEFAVVFQDIQGLPPSRRHDRAIHLKEGVNIPYLRPYKCPHFYETEVEKMVQEMLHSGIIRPSISPF